MHFFGLSPLCDLEICSSLFVQTAKLAEARKCEFRHGYVDYFPSLCERNIIKSLSWRWKYADWQAATSSEFAQLLTDFSIWVFVSKVKLRGYCVVMTRTLKPSRNLEVTNASAISFVMSARLSVHMEKLSCQWAEFL